MTPWQLYAAGLYEDFLAADYDLSDPGFAFCREAWIRQKQFAIAEEEASAVTARVGSSAHHVAEVLSRKAAN